MSKSLSTNYIFNLIDTITKLLFPLITFPYASRIMQAEGIGWVNFYGSIISYISLIVGLGIPLYAVKKISCVRNNHTLLSQTTTEILTLHLTTTALGYIIIIILSLTIPKIQENLELFILMSSSIFFTTIGCDWFYQGIEDFKYITIRALIVRIVSVLFLFLLVRTKSDLMWYGAYSVLSSVGNNIFNFVKLRKIISFKHIRYKELRPFRHIHGITSTFILTAISTLYLTLNPTILGFVSGEKSVGYYSAGIKVYTMVFGIIYVLTTISMPRFSNLIAENKVDELKEKAQNSYEFGIMISFPMSIGLYFISAYIIRILCGTGFEEAIIVSRIASLMLFVVGLSSIWGMQLLYPLGYVKILIKCTCLAALVDLLVCVIFIPQYAHVAAAFAYLLAEIVATIVEYVCGRKILPLKFMTSSIIHYLFGGIFMGIFLFIISQLNLNNFWMCTAMATCGSLFYGTFLLFIKDKMFIKVLDRIKIKFYNR